MACKKALTSIAFCGIIIYVAEVSSSPNRVDRENAGIAQLVEQLICNQQVGGSSPSTSSKSRKAQLHMGGFPSGQREQTVNLSSMTSVVRIHHLPPPFLQFRYPFRVSILFFTLFKIEYGRFPEWPKGTDCKSVVYDFGGSNPPPPTKKDRISCDIRSFFIGAQIQSAQKKRSPVGPLFFCALPVMAQRFPV